MAVIVAVICRSGSLCVVATWVMVLEMGYRTGSKGFDAVGGGWVHRQRMAWKAVGDETTGVEMGGDSCAFFVRAGRCRCFGVMVLLMW